MSIEYSDAFKELQKAHDTIDGADELSGAEKDAQIKMAFFSLYQAAKLANMIFYAKTARKRSWCEGGTFTWYQTEFQEITSILFKKYFTDGRFPKDTYKEEFDKWADRICQYINRLNQQSLALWN